MNSEELLAAWERISAKVLEYEEIDASQIKDPEYAKRKKPKNQAFHLQ